MKITIKSAPVNMAGMGPVAWDRDEHRVSMHPPLPDHIEYVEKHMERNEHAHRHHIVQRRHPEADNEQVLIPHEIGENEFKRTQHLHLHHLLEHHAHHAVKRTKYHLLHFRHSDKGRESRRHEDLAYKDE